MLEEVDAFLADQSPEAYVKVVDRLLKSPRFGERMVWDWLDAARYADTNGYQGDPTRTMYFWRDWVIDALNNNRPFDQFTVEQLSGDSLINKGPGRADNGNFVLTEFKLQVAGKPVDLSGLRATFEQGGFPIAHAVDNKNDTGWAIASDFGKTQVALFDVKAPLNANAAEALAQRVLRDPARDDAARLTEAFRRCTSRRPNDAELAVLTKRLQLLRATFSNDEDAVKKLISVGDSRPNDKLNATDLAAYTGIGTLLLNLDETISKE